MNNEVVWIIINQIDLKSFLMYIGDYINNSNQWKNSDFNYG